MLAYDWHYDSHSTASAAQRFTMTYKPLTRAPMRWREEVLATAQHIADSETRPLVVCMSGGIDSEVIARAFIELGVSFSALTAEFTDGSNTHDTDHARRFCAAQGITQHWLKLDPVQAFGDGMERWISDGYEAWSPYRYLQLYLLERAERLGACSVHGGGTDCQTYFTVNHQICYKQNSGVVCALQWMARNHQRHYPYFYSSTPEMVAAYQQIDLIAVMLRDSNYFRSFSRSSYSPEKQIVMHAQWPGMAPRPKYDGFENIRAQADSVSRSMADRFPHLCKRWFPVNDMRAQLGMEPL
jgi:hypothetical protein